MAQSDLARDAAHLVSIAHTSRARSLNELVRLAARQDRAYPAAAAALWADGEPLLTAASHPDISALLDVQLDTRNGPVLDALATGEPTECADALTEDRWPEFAHAALCRGVRSSVTLLHASAGGAVTLSLFGVRPRAGAARPHPLAELLVAVGGAVIGNAAEYDEALRTAWQLQDAVESRALVDQAKGMLMESLGCDAEEALARMREVSQHHNLRVTEVARRIVHARLTGNS